MLMLAVRRILLKTTRLHLASPPRADQKKWDTCFDLVCWTLRCPCEQRSVSAVLGGPSVELAVQVSNLSIANQSSRHSRCRMSGQLMWRGESSRYPLPPASTTCLYLPRRTASTTSANSLDWSACLTLYLSESLDRGYHGGEVIWGCGTAANRISPMPLTLPNRA